MMTCKVLRPSFALPIEGLLPQLLHPSDYRLQRIYPVLGIAGIRRVAGVRRVAGARAVAEASRVTRNVHSGFRLTNAFRHDHLGARCKERPLAIAPLRLWNHKLSTIDFAHIGVRLLIDWPVVNP